MSEERKMQLPALFLVPFLSQNTVASSCVGSLAAVLGWSAQPLLLPSKATSPHHSALAHKEGEPIPNTCQPKALLRITGNAHYHLN